MKTLFLFVSAVLVLITLGLSLYGCYYVFNLDKPWSAPEYLLVSQAFLFASIFTKHLAGTFDGKDAEG